MWLFKEIGAYIVFVCDELPDIAESQLEIDRTGFKLIRQLIRPPNLLG